MYHFEKETLKNLEIFERKKMGLFWKMSLGSPMPLVQRFIYFYWLKGSMSLVQRLFFIWKFFSFFGERFGNLEFFYKKKKIYIYIYIHEQSTSNATWIFRIQRNIETWNKQKNFKLNHDVANQMWSEAKLGHLLLLSPFRMLKTGYAWTLIMMKWLGLALGRHASCALLAFDVAHVYTPLMSSSVGLWLIQETILGFYTK